MNERVFFALIWAGVAWVLTGCQFTESAPVEAETNVSISGTRAAGSVQETVVTPTSTPTQSFLPLIVHEVETYFVSPDGNDDSGDGSFGNPWATISWASDQVPDRAAILVQPGDYYGEVDLSRKFDQGIIISSVIPYQARLRYHDKVVNCHLCKGITLEGFDIAHNGAGAGRYLVQIQDANGQGDGGKDVVIRNNVLHDSYNNDLLKINNGADQVIVEGNVFYNQSGSDSHIDVNSATNIVIQDNIFFNDFAGSGRINNNDTGSFIVVKDSNGTNDRNLGSSAVTIRRNLFLNWEGLSSNTLVVIGEDSVVYYQAYDVLIENNLFLGNSSHVSRGVLGVKGARDIVFRHNTVVGDLPAKAYAMRLNLQDGNQVNRNIEFYNNVWSDPTGTMGSEGEGTPNDFSDSLPEETASFLLLSNLYWNGGSEIPFDDTDLINYTDDEARFVADPLLPNLGEITLPRWNKSQSRFADGSIAIREAFNKIVLSFAVPSDLSPVVDVANNGGSADEDILGQARDDGAPDIGAYELD